MTPSLSVDIAEAILGLHVFVIAFSVFGLVAIPLGAWGGWRGVRVFWWRALHIGILGIVALQAVLTPRWRKTDSNSRSLSRGFAVIFGEEKGPQAISVVSKDFAFKGGDRWFESASLQRRVCCEPDFLEGRRVQRGASVAADHPASPRKARSSNC